MNGFGDVTRSKERRGTTDGAIFVRIDVRRERWRVYRGWRGEEIRGRGLGVVLVNSLSNLGDKPSVGFV